jgi:4-hydroxyphenylpyruvate dioxygenase
MQSDDDVRRLRGDVDRFFDQAAALGAGVVTAAGTLLDIGTEETAVADLDSLGRWAGGYGLNISFEFFGHAKSYSTLREAIGLLSAVRAPNTGITLDTFLFHQGGSSISDISNLAGPADRLLSVQVADSSPGSIATLDTLKGRRLPGQGVIQLQDILNAVVAAGYRGYFVVEVFNDPLSPADALRCARSVRESMLDILGSINGSADIDPA